MAIPEANQKDAPDALSERVEEIMRLYLTNESEEDILPLVDDAFANLDSVEHVCQLLDFLPRTLTAKKFITVLEKERSKRSAQIAKANFGAVESINVDAVAKRKLYLLMHECLACESSCAEEALHMLVRYLSTFTKVEDYTGEVEEKACVAIISALKLPMWRFDEVSDLVPVRALAASKSPSNRQLFALFDIFCHKGINDYQNMSAANTELVETAWGLSSTELLEKIRLLSLCRLAQEKRAQGSDPMMTYSEIASALNINEEEIEPVIVRAVGLTLLVCRVNQMKRNVRIGYIHHAMFTHDQWRQLQETLGAWKDNVSELLSRFDELKAQRSSEMQ